MAAFSSSAFSTSAFSTSAFDFGGVTPALVGGGDVFHHYDKYLAKERAANLAASLAELNKDIATNEKAEKPLIRKAKRNTEAEMKLLALQDEINALRLEREALVRMIDDEEAIFILLASTPFN